MRSIKTLGDGWQRLLYLNPSVKPMTVEGVEALTLRLTRPRHASKPMRKLISTAVMRYSGLSKNGGVAGVKTGFETFDSVNGGLRAGLYYIIAAQTNIGKSSWTLNVISNALARGEGVALFSLEMSQDDVVDMLVSNRASIHRDVWNTGLLSDHDQTKMMVHLPQLAESRLWIFDDPDMNIVDIRQKAEDLSNQESVKLIVVDYMQFVAPLPGSRESREQQVSIISRGLKAMAKTTGVPVIGISSLNDDGKLRESRGSGYDADAVMELSELGDDALIGRVTKGRFIAKKPYKFNFHKATCKITDGGIYTETAPEQPRGKKAARNYHND
jgi:replicative DNA helicase